MRYAGPLLMLSGILLAVTVAHLVRRVTRRDQARGDSGNELLQRRAPASDEEVQTPRERRRDIERNDAMHHRHRSDDAEHDQDALQLVRRAQAERESQHEAEMIRQRDDLFGWRKADATGRTIQLSHHNATARFRRFALGLMLLSYSVILGATLELIDCVRVAPGDDGKAAHRKRQGTAHSVLLLGFRLRSDWNVVCYEGAHSVWRGIGVGVGMPFVVFVTFGIPVAAVKFGHIKVRADREFQQQTLTKMRSDGVTTPRSACSLKATSAKSTGGRRCTLRVVSSSAFWRT